MFKLTDSAINTSSLQELLADERAGALVEFTGRVRNHNEGRHVISLEYEAAPSLATAEASRILAEARQRYSLYRAVCLHRTGLLQVGEAAVYVAVTADHRDEGFQACRYIIDEIKHRLPIWKKETYADGSSGWVNCRHHQELSV